MATPGIKADPGFAAPFLHSTAQGYLSHCRQHPAAYQGTIVALTAVAAGYDALVFIPPQVQEGKRDGEASSSTPCQCGVVSYQARYETADRITDHRMYLHIVLLM